MKKIIFSIIILFFISINAQSQTDTEFWLACPDLNGNHGKDNSQVDTDAPILLHFATMDKPATIIVAQPALNWTEDPIELGAYEAYTYVLTPRKANLECVTPDTIENKGLYITSTTPITAYYEVSNLYNSDLITLKGSSALGVHFFVSGQNRFSTDLRFASASTFSCDIVATEDQTEVWITPTKDVVGHNTTDGKYSIILNRGQTYSMQLAFFPPAKVGADRPIGSEIVSSKPIAVTIKDCSITPSNTWGSDLVMDQIVPVNNIGQEYILVNGSLTGSLAIDGILKQSGDFYFVTATDDNTEVFIDGDTVPIAKINKGETYQGAFGAVYALKKSTYIKTTKPAYIFHVTGDGLEIGGATVPSIICTGSNRVSFQRTGMAGGLSNNDPLYGYTPTRFYLTISIRKGFENDLWISTNKDTAQKIPTIEFTEVPGKSDWVAAKINYSNLPKGSNNEVFHKEGEPFHLGLITGDGDQTCRYGFFSDFKTIKIKPLARPNLEYCEGDAMKITTTPYEGTYYSWISPKGEVLQQGVYIPNGSKIYTYNIPKLTPADSGTYSIISKSGGCLADTSNIKIIVYSNPKVKLPNDTSFCSGKTIEINASEYANPDALNTSYEWFPTGDTTNFIITDPNPGTTTYGVIVTNTYPTITCHSSDSIKVNISEVPAISFITNPNPARGYEPLDVSFINNTDPSTSQYLWKFGDGSTSSTETNPTHTFVVQDPNADSLTYDITLIAKTSDFCIDSLTFSGIITVLNDPTYDGIINIGKDEIKLHIYPNPATSALTLDNDKKALGKVELFTTNGICVFKEDFNQATLITIPINHLPAGAYLLKINGQVKKIIKY